MKYRGYDFSNPHKGYQNWRCTFMENGKPRVRFGTIEELKSDVDLVVSGIGLPAPERGYA